MEFTRTLARWWRGLDPLLVDVILATGVSVIGLLEVLTSTDWQDGSQALSALGVVGCGLLLLWRRRWPALVLVGIFAVLLGNRIADAGADETTAAFVAALIAGYSLGLNAPGRDAVIAVIASAALFTVDLALNPHSNGFNDVVFAVSLIFVAPVLAGRALRNRHLLARELEEKARAIEAEREERAARAVMEERARIARELHDVVSHSVSLMVVQAGAARRVIDHDRQAARDSFATVEETGRAALVEMRRLLGVLRRTEEEPALAPQPSLAYLDALLDRAQHAGLNTDLKVEGEPVELAPGVDLAAYRVIQEGLANSLRHSGARRAIVTVRYGVRDLEIEVADDGPVGDPPDEPDASANGRALLGEGRGLVSMRERVALYGGELSAGRRRGGGFALRARLPLQRTAA
jgi:signal transduction histidine kinase